MVLSVVIWHNPRCSKSRATLVHVEEHVPEHVVRFYLKNPPSGQEIRDVLAMLGVGAHALIRNSEKVYRDLDLSPDHDDTALIAAMEAHPILIERPIVIAKGKAVIGRPPEAVLRIL